MNSDLTREQSNELYLALMDSGDTEAMRKFCREDLFFLLTVGMKRKDIDNEWLYQRIREVEASPNGHLDLWAREHYKSTIITFGLSIQDALKNPERTNGIFSHTRPIAKAFLEQIKRELEQNTFLKDLFPDVLYKNPQSEAPKWSLDSGLILKRKTNPKEATFEAWGLVDGQPTGKHFDTLTYDDIVTRESVTTPEQIKKVTEALELSYNLGSRGGVRRFIGTRYHSNDTYKTIMSRGTVIPRIHTATDNGKADGNPVLMTAEQLAEKRRDMGPYTFGTQMLQDPVADKAMGFKEEWLRDYEKIDWTGWNLYLLCDPASKKKKSNDYTVFVVIGLGPDGNYYLIDGIRDRLNLTQRVDKLFQLHRKYKPLKVGYEEYGIQADIEHAKYVMEQKNYRFNITPLGGQVAKEDRIKALIPIFEQQRFFLPKVLWFTDYENKRVDFVQKLKDDEYLSFPVSTHDDMMDCIARILDVGAEFPEEQKPLQTIPTMHQGNLSWMG